MPVKRKIPESIRLQCLKKRCEHCPTSEQLGLHHKDENRENNSPENLQTLCAKCHTKWHWQNGKTAKINSVQLTEDEFSDLSKNEFDFSGINNLIFSPWDEPQLEGML